MLCDETSLTAQYLENSIATLRLYLVNLSQQVAQSQREWREDLPILGGDLAYVVAQSLNLLCHARKHCALPRCQKRACIGCGRLTSNSLCYRAIYLVMFITIVFT